jgi:hypothetical protein
MRPFFSIFVLFASSALAQAQSMQNTPERQFDRDLTFKMEGSDNCPDGWIGPVALPDGRLLLSRFGTVYMLDAEGKQLWKYETDSENESLTSEPACGALKAALNRKDLEKLPKAQRWLSHVEGAWSHRQPLDPADGEHAELASLLRGKVVAQLWTLKAQPAVARAVQEGRLTVHGWYYDILSGRIEQFDEQMRRFLPLTA